MVTTACLLCGEKDLTYVTDVREEDMRIYRCGACGLEQINPTPTAEQDAEYYRNTVVYRHLISKDMLSDEVLQKKMEQWVLPQAETLESMVEKDASILEIGSGYGLLVELMRKRGFDMQGIEINSQQRQDALNRAGIKLYDCNLMLDSFSPGMLGRRFDVVCLFHVLEHMNNPVFFLKNAATMLRPGGRLIVEVPNNDDIMKRVSPSYSRFSYKRQHISYFTEQTLQDVISRAGFLDTRVKGIQRYSIENAFYWKEHEAPNMEKYQLELEGPLHFVDALYKRRLEEDLVSDDLLATATKTDV